MKILLDTHIWLWIQDDPGKIRANLWQTLVNPENELWLSPVSTWEALVLESKGRIQLPGKIADWVARNTAPFREAPFTHEVAMVAQQLSWENRDPADRFLAATAKVFGLTLATADTKLLGLGDIATLANR